MIKIIKKLSFFNFKILTKSWNGMEHGVTIQMIGQTKLKSYWTISVIQLMVSSGSLSLTSKNFM